jgi:histidinol-phosphatase
MAACSIIVTEAGGKFTDLDGHPGPLGTGGYATNGRLHEAVLSQLALQDDDGFEDHDDDHDQQ